MTQAWCFLASGHGLNYSQVLSVVQRLLWDSALRQELSDRLRSKIDGRAAERIAHRVRGILKGL